MNQEELKKRLMELLDNLNFEYGEILADCYENNAKHDVPFGEFFAEKLIANGVTIRECGEWIPVTERLPEEKVMVLGFYHIVYKDGGHYDLILVMELRNGLFVPFNCSPIKRGSVTHWMPLPEPPEAEKGGE